MSTAIIIVIVVVVLLVVVAAAAVAARKRRSKKLQEGFGPEYDRALEQHGSRKEAEGHLKERQSRRKEMDIRPLEPASRERYSQEWRKVQARFVDAPEDATRDADRLVGEVMRERGYPVDDFDQRSEDLSVDHPGVVENYRAAHGISQRNDRGEATTEELRQATVHYRSLFDELLGDGHDGGSTEHGEQRGARAEEVR